MGVRVLRSPVRAPTANSFCGRFGGTLRRDCLDFLPFNKRHLKFVLKAWIAYVNNARPHMSLGPGIPAALHPPAQQSAHRRRIPAGHTVRRAAVLGDHLPPRWSLEPSVVRITRHASRIR